ncbi:hypothetical protein OG978_33675 [Streptomyces sp. NBC_01591]|uniref:hypothetical protein n=1 Tax=Streptomyces sp. NBC_01591 TaxID=2975888 RepID=UPI002DDB0957|nr:hypothetical protein [Streptomyces sp. NBC_01591]WSD71912.1 hypothetical protein OG978_33675 [Streptomyces sp. NBC_01591]
MDAVQPTGAPAVPIATPAAMPSADTAHGRQLLAEQVIGFRIMKQTEIAPGWWGQPVEVGETGSGTVAYNFCREQNAVTMDLNRPKMIQFFVEPMSPADVAAHEAASYVLPTPTVDVAELLMATADLLLEQPRQILTHAHLVETVLRAAGPQVSTVALRPVWEALPMHRSGDEHWKYAARLVLAAKSIRAVAA